jgi:hypothetical protein
VEVSTREVEAIAWPKHCVDQGRLLSSFLNLRLPIGPRLITERGLQDRWMNQPPFFAFDLQHEDVMHVVMSAEALILGWSDVRVGLYGMAQFGGELLAEFKNRRQDAMQGLQHQSRAVSKEPDELVITDLICNSGPNAARGGEGPVGEGCTVLRDAEERGPQTALGNQLVDRICIEQLAKSTSRKIASWGQQRLLPPVLTRELITVDSYKSIENRVFSGSGRRWLSGQVLAHHADWFCLSLPAGTAICAAVGSAVRATVSSAVGSTIAYARHALGAAIS